MYQEKSLGEKQPLWRNIFVGRQITNRFGFIKVAEERRIANDLLTKRLGFRGVGIDAIRLWQNSPAVNGKGSRSAGRCILTPI